MAKKRRQSKKRSQRYDRSTISRQSRLAPDVNIDVFRIKNRRFDATNTSSYNRSRIQSRKAADRFRERSLKRYRDSVRKDHTRSIRQATETGRVTDTLRREICTRRAIKRAVLFAMHAAGGRGGMSFKVPRILRPESKVRC